MQCCGFVRFGLTLGEAHDNRLCSALVTGFEAANDGACRSRLRRRLDQGSRQRARRMGQHPAEAQSQRPYLLQPTAFIVRAIWRSGSSAGLSCDKLAANYLAFVQLASTRSWL